MPFDLMVHLTLNIKLFHGLRVFAEKIKSIFNYSGSGLGLTLLLHFHKKHTRFIKLLKIDEGHQTSGEGNCEVTPR